MTIRANFIGIDKYLDPDIRDLTGARNDAKALWSLFSDTIPDIDANLILDEDATSDCVSKTIEQTLKNATENDTVIITFAGHGTNDHRLVTYNTTVTNLQNSSISMDEIALLFKESPAKVILFILDCCFSGRAPARVFEDSPTPRAGGNPYSQLAGEGRVLIAASNYDEVAYEMPGSGHGLLTNALIEVLQSGDKQIDILKAMAQILEIVRAEAGRMGLDQTPVLVGSVTGGLLLPRLQMGTNHYNHFPEAKGIKISNNIKDLSAFNIPDKILDTWDILFTDGLNDIQLAAVNEHRILDGQSLLVVAPTSSGKTFVGEMAAAKAIMEGRKTVFLFPYRALTSEKYEQFQQMYGEDLAMRVIRCTGDYADQTGPFVSGKYDLALLTYEMFLNLAVNNPWILNQIALIVIDEAQFIADPHRGIVVELLLTYILTSREQGINPQLIALSAVIGNINDYDNWLGCQKLVTDKRPVPLREGVIDRSGIYQYLNEHGDIETVELLPAGMIRQRRNKPSAQDVIVPLVRKLIQDNKDEKIIIFRNMRGTAEGAANYLAEDLGLPAATETLQLLPSYDLSSTSERLRKCLNGGTAFHNTNLSREEKAIVEQGFRDPDSKVRILGATTTVAAGINTPASTVIIAEQHFVGEDQQEFTVAQYKNMAGRAGRVGFQEEGKSIIIAETSYQQEQLFNRYVKGDLEQLESSVDPDHIETWVIRLLAQIDRVKREDVSRLLANTYGGYVANKNNPKWQSETTQRIEDLLDRMISYGLVEQENEFVQLSLLGRACGSSALTFESSLRLVEFIDSVTPENLSLKWLMAIVQALPELDDSYTPVMKRGTKEMARQREAVDIYNRETIAILQKYAPGQFEYYARCKRAAILWDWINGESIETIERRYSTTPYQGKIGYGDVRKFADATRYHLRSAYQIANVKFIGQVPDEELMESLLKQLEVGIPHEALELLEIPISLERGQYLALYSKGIGTVDELWERPKEELSQILGEQQVKALEKLRPS